MLKVYKGASSKSYENTFFREVSKKLVKLFEQHNWEGILLGMPFCRSRDDLQIDCLLITSHQIIIIDLKNYSGTLKLPSEKEFQKKRWFLNEDIVVKGGSATNPFLQLERQREKLFEELELHSISIKRNKVSTMVLFHDTIDLIGTIPRRFQMRFFIADAQNYLNQIMDIVDIEDDQFKNDSLLVHHEKIVKQLFQVEPYVFDYHEEVREIEAVEAPLQIEANFMESVEQFLVSDRKIMTIDGGVGSEKTAIIPHIREAAFDAEFTSAHLLAYSNRLRKKLLLTQPDLEDVESLFKTIYDFRNEQTENLQKLIPLRNVSEEDEHSLYIIYDGQLITNSKRNSPFVQFGSGQLLDDLFSYVNFEKYPKRKIIFIGDSNQLSYGKTDEGALNAHYLKSILEQNHLNSEVVELKMPTPKSADPLIQTCQEIGQAIDHNEYNYLSIQPSEKLQICTSTEWVEAVHEIYANPYKNKILVYQNKQVDKVNKWVKRHLLKDERPLAKKDFIIFDTTIQARESQAQLFDSSEEQQGLLRIDNGDFGVIVDVFENKRYNISEQVGDQLIELTFVWCRIQLQSNELVELFVLENYIKAQGGELSEQEVATIHIRLERIKKQKFNSHPFIKSEEFKEMKQDPTQYVEIVEKDKVKYRDPSDRRKLTYHEKKYRERMVQELNHPNNLYFQILNAAKLKHAWAMTVHKAMAYYFDTIVFNTELGENHGKTNRSYFKFLYTGIATATDCAKLVQWTPITPFFKTNFGKNSNALSSKNKIVICSLSKSAEENVALQLREYLEEKLQGIATVIGMNSKQYLEIVKFEIYGRTVELFFDYNTNYDIRKPRHKSGAIEDAEKIIQALLPTENKQAEESTPVTPFLTEMKHELHDEKITMTWQMRQEWQLIVQLKREEKVTDVQLYYKSEGSITQFNYVNGDQDLYDEVVQWIQNKYR